jgi:hypothetical protein
LLSLLFAGTAGPAIAQTSATLAGVVQDASGGVLPGAQVAARNVATGVTRQTTTESDVRFTLAGLPAGDYEVRSELSGFRPLVRTGLRLTVGENASLTRRCRSRHGSVTVSGAAFRSTRAPRDSVTSWTSTIAQLPVNGRNYTDLMSLFGRDAFPHRDNGSAVAHGLAMSVNGRGPREMHLLGTLLNDFTNSPAGSAGTARHGHRAEFRSSPTPTR